MELIGSLGVAILLAAFFANLTGRLESTSRAYQSMNALGAAIAAYASWGIGFMPFVALEATWCVVACISLARPPATPLAREPDHDV
jgi:hypothetical protein